MIKAVIDEMRHGGWIREVAATSGGSEGAVVRWRQQDPPFRDTSGARAGQGAAWEAKHPTRN